MAYAKTNVEKAKVSLILDYVFPGEKVSVPDPYYDDNGFEEVFKLLEHACEKIIAEAVQ